MRENGLIAPTKEELDIRAFYIASKNGNIKKMQQLLSSNKITNINMQDKNGRTPLHFASAYGRTDAVQFLLKQGANKDIADNYNIKPIEYAKENGYKDVVFLLERWGK